MYDFLPIFTSVGSHFLFFSMQTRYCVKWKSSEGKLVLKITDNTTVRLH